MPEDCYDINFNYKYSPFVDILLSTPWRLPVELFGILFFLYKFINFPTDWHVYVHLVYWEEFAFKVTLSDSV